ncbi:hypothetical protein [Kitasatospora mediocidica]|uniref:hypothetical protein n=1 Tax=Kitasatospora mediocidica TaxID=58352 RepID=UPI0012F7D13C|nr:hypothetical protein [Kitasatospora mediocidica]
MNTPRKRLRDEGLARTASWTRRCAAAAAVLCAALAGVFAHVLPGQAATATNPGTSSSPAQHHLQPSAQPPSAGTGRHHVTSGGS